MNANESEAEKEHRALLAFKASIEALEEVNKKLHEQSSQSYAYYCWSRSFPPGHEALANGYFSMYKLNHD